MRTTEMRSENAVLERMSLDLPSTTRFHKPPAVGFLLSFARWTHIMFSLLFHDVGALLDYLSPTPPFIFPLHRHPYPIKLPSVRVLRD